MIISLEDNELYCPMYSIKYNTETKLGYINNFPYKVGYFIPYNDVELIFQNLRLLYSLDEENYTECLNIVSKPNWHCNINSNLKYDIFSKIVSTNVIINKWPDILWKFLKADKEGKYSLISICLSDAEDFIEYILKNNMYSDDNIYQILCSTLGINMNILDDINADVISINPEMFAKNIKILLKYIPFNNYKDLKIIAEYISEVEIYEHLLDNYDPTEDDNLVSKNLYRYQNDTFNQLTHKSCIKLYLKELEKEKTIV